MEYNCAYVSTELKVGFESVRPCSMYVSTELDRARCLFRPCSRYVATVFDECVCFDCGRGMFRPLSRYVSNLCSTQTVSTLSQLFLLYCISIEVIRKSHTVCFGTHNWWKSSSPIQEGVEDWKY